MGYALYQYPEKALVNRTIPKTKFYEKANITKTVKDAFIRQIQNIVWAYKLSPETINLNTTKDLLEIQVFNISLKTTELDERVLLAIDKAIPHPIIFQLNFEDRIQVKLAFKRINEADPSKWIIDQYFSSPWIDIEETNTLKISLPIALNLANLYEQILKELMPIKAKAAENIREQSERYILISQKIKEIEQIKKKMHNEKQFKRRVELNSKLKEFEKQVEKLKI
jgi:hypothetical protein